MRTYGRIPAPVNQITVSSAAGIVDDQLAGYLTILGTWAPGDTIKVVSTIPTEDGSRELVVTANYTVTNASQAAIASGLAAQFLAAAPQLGSQSENNVCVIMQTWVEVNDDSGDPTQVYITTLCQVLQLNINESPFYGNYGIPAQEDIISQIYPDYYAAITQKQFSPYFASLVISRVANQPNPTYNVNVTTKMGSSISGSVVAQ